MSNSPVGWIVSLIIIVFAVIGFMTLQIIKVDAIFPLSDIINSTIIANNSSAIYYNSNAENYLSIYDLVAWVILIGGFVPLILQILVRERRAIPVVVR